MLLCYTLYKQCIIRTDIFAYNKRRDAGYISSSNCYRQGGGYHKLFFPLKTTPVLATARSGFFIVFFKKTSFENKCRYFTYNCFRDFFQKFYNEIHNYHLLSFQLERRDNKPPSQYAVTYSLPHYPIRRNIIRIN